MCSYSLNKDENMAWVIEDYIYLNFRKSSRSVEVHWTCNNSADTTEKKSGQFTFTLDNAGIIASGEKTEIETKITNEDGIRS